MSIPKLTQAQLSTLSASDILVCRCLGSDDILCDMLSLWLDRYMEDGIIDLVPNNVDDAIELWWKSNLDCSGNNTEMFAVFDGKIHSV